MIKCLKLMKPFSSSNKSKAQITFSLMRRGI